MFSQRGFIVNNKNKITLSSLALVVSIANADVTNGGFESWTTSTPDNWTTIDSGISVTKNNQIVKAGSSSAAIAVNTGTQSATDIQQLVAVEAGKSYEFSTWVYHTLGAVKARLYVDGYQGYSNENLINQWQQISYTYNATSSKNIAVGLRFYDLAGFSGSETVYIDDFQPTTNSGGTGGGCANTEAVLTLVTDNYGSETSWSLSNSSETVIASGNNLSNATTYTENLCLADDTYTFKIDDAYGDGICCTYGNGSYDVKVAGASVVSGASFQYSESKSFTINKTGGGNNGGDPTTYYASITNQTGFALKTALHNIIKNHTAQGYSALWTFYENHSLDKYFENDGSILDIYSEKPVSADSYNYVKVSGQCGSYTKESDCYNREHSFPKSWFGGKIEPMNSDVHHIFATDGFVNSKRSSYPYGEVASASFTSTNNSKLGTAISSLGFSGTVFEPIDEFKGDLARAHLYMATRYEDVISSWQSNSDNSGSVLNGTSDQVFNTWVWNMMLRWHKNDPVSQKEIDRNNAAFEYQGNRNPFVDHPEYVDKIWTN